MPEQKQIQKAEKIEKKPFVMKESEEMLIRISGYDIPGSRSVFVGLTRIKGVSWALSNAICLKLNLDRMKKISELKTEEIKQIEKFLEKPEIPAFLKNRRYDPESGETVHLIGTKLDMTKDFDIRRMKKIKSYKGLRHIAGQPVRGQRTRSHFRKRGQPVKRKGKTGGETKPSAPTMGGKK